MGKQLILVGGGHAHMVTLANLHKFIEKGHRVAVIGPSPHHYYSGMGPGMLAKIYKPEEIRFDTKQVVEKQGGTFKQDTVVRVDPEAKILQLLSGETTVYDVLSFNAGSYVPDKIVADNSEDVFPVKPIEKLLEAQGRILALASLQNITIGIVGGGPAAAEIAGNTWRLAHDRGQPRS